MNLFFQKGDPKRIGKKCHKETVLLEKIMVLAQIDGGIPVKGRIVNGKLSRIRSMKC